MRNIALLIVVLASSPLAFAVNCDKNPNHSQCQGGGGSGELTVYDADDVPVRSGPRI